MAYFLERVGGFEWVKPHAARVFELTPIHTKK